jgi:hypothetical protein
MKAESSCVLKCLVRSVQPRAAASSWLFSVSLLSTSQNVNSVNDVSVHPCHNLRELVKYGSRSTCATVPRLHARLHLRWLHAQPQDRCFATGVVSTNDCRSHGGLFATSSPESASATGARGHSVTALGTAPSPDVDGRNGGVPEKDGAALQGARIGAERPPSVEALLRHLPQRLERIRESDKAEHMLEVRRCLVSPSVRMHERDYCIGTVRNPGWVLPTQTCMRAWVVLVVSAISGLVESQTPEATSGLFSLELDICVMMTMVASYIVPPDTEAAYTRARPGCACKVPPCSAASQTADHKNFARPQPF